MEPLSPDYLRDLAYATALDFAAAYDTGEPVERRAIPAREAAVDWSPVLLRRVFEQEVAVYDPLGELEIAIDRAGKLWSLDDPRHAPASGSIRRSEAEAVESVLRLMGESAEDVHLQADLVRTRDRAFLRVKNREPRKPAFESKFFERREEERPKGPPPDRIEADVNAESGHVFRFRRTPPPAPGEAAPEGEKKS